MAQLYGLVYSWMPTCTDHFLSIKTNTSFYTVPAIMSKQAEWSIHDPGGKDAICGIQINHAPSLMRTDTQGSPAGASPEAALWRTLPF